MDSINNKRVWLSTIIGILVIFLIYWSIPDQTLEARGLFLPSKNTEKPISENLVVFYANAPDTYKELGLIRIARHYPAKNAKLAEREILSLAKKLAAQAGANAVVVKVFAHSLMSVTPAPQAIYSFQGVAISSNALPQNNLSSTFSLDLDPSFLQEGY